MNEESLSALLDGECDPSELDEMLSEFSRDPQLRARYSRLRLARDIRRGVMIRKPGLDFADAVMAALDRQPATPRVQRGHWMTGLALAATLAAVAFLALRPHPADAPATAGPQPAAVATDWSALDATSSRQLKNYLLEYNRARTQQGMAGTMGYVRYAAYTMNGVAPPPPAKDRP